MDERNTFASHPPWSSRPWTPQHGHKSCLRIVKAYLCSGGSWPSSASPASHPPAATLCRPRTCATTSTDERIALGTSATGSVDRKSKHLLSGLKICRWKQAYIAPCQIPEHMVDVTLVPPKEPIEALQRRHLCNQNNTSCCFICPQHLYYKTVRLGQETIHCNRLRLSMHLSESLTDSHSARLLW